MVTNKLTLYYYYYYHKTVLMRHYKFTFYLTSQYSESYTEPQVLAAEGHG